MHLIGTLQWPRIMPALLCLVGLLGGPASGAAGKAAVEVGDATNDQFLVHPQGDGGAHPKARTEWWYVTGWLNDSGHPVGFQITFFRSAIPAQENNPSAFAAKQIILAHAALSDPRQGKILFDQRSMRAGFGLAEARTDMMDVHIRDWTLKRANSNDDFDAHIDANRFALHLHFHCTQGVLLEGDQGISHKGPSNASVSAYYSLPQLEVSGEISEDGHRKRIDGKAWLDHEWSDSYLDPAAQGWDWLGANLNDGGALMAFRMRRADGSVLWSSATRRDEDGSVHYFAPEQVRFTTLGSWVSPASGVRYPVAQQLTVGAEHFRLEPLMNDQEIDAGASTGTLYWEGAVSLQPDAERQGSAPLGEGYLELTGYGSKLRLN